MKLLCAFAICSCAWGQIGRPIIGKMLDSTGAVRTVYGIASSVTPGDEEITGVISSACATFCLAKTATSIVSPTGTVDAPAGPALFAFDGDSAFLWFTQSKQLAKWRNDALTMMTASVDGQVLSLRAKSGSIEFAVRRQDGVWIVTPDGAVVDALPSTSGPLELLNDSAVYTTRDEIIVRDVRIPLKHVTSFSRMSADYVQVRAGAAVYALRITSGNETLFALPAVQTSGLTLYAGTTAVSSTFQFGQVAVNSTSSVTFQVANTGSAPVTVTTVTLGGAGFTFPNPPATPWVIPGNSKTLSFVVSFTPTSTASFNASLTIASSAGTISTILYGSGALAPILISGAGCSSSVPFNWGNVPVGTVSPCTFSLENANPQAVTVPAVSVNGTGFNGPNGISAPLTLQPGQTVSFTVNFAPIAGLPYSGTLLVGTQSFALIGTGLQALLPTPLLQFDSQSYASAQQGTLTVTIPGGSPVAASGYVTITFAPSTAAVKDDSEIAFVANASRTIPFSVSPGSTTALLNGQNSAVFQTGTTEGTITFTLTTAAAMTGTAPIKQFTIGGTKVIIDSTSASKERTGYLDITIIGADNTYSAGAMSFAFFDTSGNAIGSAVTSDFTSAFKTYYGGKSAGSAFRALVSFPVIGSVATIGSVTVTLTNAAGVSSTGSLTFQ